MGVPDKVSPLVGEGHQDAVSWGGRTFAVRGGERGALVLGNVEEGVEEEILHAFTQCGHLVERGLPAQLAGARGGELRHSWCPSADWRRCCTAGRLWRAKVPGRLAGAAAGGAARGDGGHVGGDGMSLGGRGRGSSRTGASLGGWWFSPDLGGGRVGLVLLWEG